MSGSEGLVSYGGEDIAKGRALVCSDRSMSFLAHICLNKERKVKILLPGSLFFLLVLLGTHPMGW